jgi:large subunit ribosomal protein L24
MKTNAPRLKKDDKVKIITGKDKGKIGKIMRIYRKKNRVLVENANVVKRHTRPTPQNRQGGIVESEAPIHWSNVMLVCNKCLAASRIHIRELENGERVRLCGKCNEVIDA